MAQEARYAADSLGLSPKAMSALGWRIPQIRGGIMSNRRAARAKALKAKNKKNITAMSSRDRYITGRCLACP
jgi:hypothetical protein